MVTGMSNPFVTAWFGQCLIGLVAMAALPSSADIHQ
jgi:hypothetical protein